MEWGWLRYDGDDLVHQRWVSGRAALSVSEYVGTTPDGDTYIEKYDESENDDVDLVRWSAGWNDVPNGVNPARVYRFRQEPTAAEKQIYLRDAEILADQRCRAVAAAIGRPDLLTTPGFRALVPGGPGAVAAVVAGAAPAAAGGPLDRVSCRAWLRRRRRRMLGRAGERLSRWETCATGTRCPGMSRRPPLPTDATSTSGRTAPHCSWRRCRRPSSRPSWGAPWQQTPACWR